MASIPSLEDYIASLGRLSAEIDPTAVTEDTLAIHSAAESLAALNSISVQSLTAWVQERPKGVPVLGLVVGLSQEKLKNVLRHYFGTSGWVTLARERPAELITKLDEKHDLIRQLSTQRNRQYSFGDVLVGRAGSRVVATSAGASGRKVEDEIEEIAKNLGLDYQTRTRFQGRNSRTAPCDLVVPNANDPVIVVAAKGFDSTGSKLTDAVREIEEMADVRLPRQYVMAVIDGIGWKSRTADLARMHSLWKCRQIDGMYTLATLDQFKTDLQDAAHRAGLLPPVAE